MHSALYRALPNIAVIDYDEESVVFNALTWDTHVLNAAAAQVLAMCRDHGCTLAEVTEALQHCLHAQEARFASAHAMETLDALQSLGLINPVNTQPPPAGV